MADETVSTEPSESQPKERLIRVFVSSTFRDMQAEREVLVKRVFPELRKLCDERSVVFTDVDLRWGITEEQAERGEVLPICLAEVERCSYFIGLLGQRYGEPLKNISADLIEEQPWLAEHAEKSVTELEILHGVLNDPIKLNRAFFYFRAPSTAVYESLAEPLAHAEKLHSLKQRIHKAGAHVHDGLSNADELARLVMDDLSQVIEEDFPAKAVPTPLERQAAGHEMFASSRCGVYIGRQESFDRLDEHASGNGPPMVVVGDSGTGKSALLANWAHEHRKTYPQDEVLLHFVGGTPESADSARMIRRLLNELQKRFNLKLPIPDELDALRETFANAIHMVSVIGRLVLIIDGLNQLDDRDGALELAWLPPVIPQNVRLIVSTLPGKPLTTIQERAWPTLNVEPLLPDEQKQLIHDYLKQFAKQLSDEQVGRITSSNNTNNPLFLRTLLDELRFFGSHARLDERIDYYVEARSIADLYEKLLIRWEEDYEGDTDLVGDAFSLVWAARHGLTETELLKMLGGNSGSLPRSRWSPLFLAAEPHIVNRSGLLNFAHRYLRDAVRKAYIPSLKHQRDAHIRVAKYFQVHDPDPRSIEELPWQLCKAEAWLPLSRLLGDLQFFKALWESSEFDVKAYWSEVEANSPYRKTEVYAPLLESATRSDASLGHSIFRLLVDTGHYFDARHLQIQIAEKFRETGNLIGYSEAITNLSVIMYLQGDLDEAMSLLRGAERICRKFGEDEWLGIIVGIQAVILKMRGDWKGALECHRQQERISRAANDSLGVAVAINNQAVILQDVGQFDEAMEYSKRVEQTSNAIGERTLLSRSLGNQGQILKQKGDFDSAMSQFVRQEEICRELQYKDGLVTSLGDQATIHRHRGELDVAMRLSKEQEQLARDLGKKSTIANALANQALILDAQGDEPGAMLLLKEEERICREIGYKQGLSRSLCNQAVILRNLGDYKAARRLHAEGESLCRELMWVDGLAHSLLNQSILFVEMGEIGLAISHAEECHAIATEHGLTLVLTEIQPYVEMLRSINEAN